MYSSAAMKSDLQLELSYLSLLLLEAEGNMCQRYNANIIMSVVIYNIPLSVFPIQKSLAIVQDLETEVDYCAESTNRKKTDTKAILCKVEWHIGISLQPP
jgi:hypothetical protein